jgi:hypothetical protein
LDAIEQAIRNAFAKGNPEDPAFRERVYRSAHAALEKALLANSALAPEVAERRRKALMSAVSSIESEFIPAVEPARPPPPAPEPSAIPEPPVVAERHPRPSAPEIAVPTPTEAPRPQAGRRDPDFAATDERPDWPAAPEPLRPVLSGDAPPLAGLAPQGQMEERRKTLVPEPRRGRWGLIAGLLIFLVIIGLAVWTAVELGFLNLSARQGTAQVEEPAAGGDNSGPRKPGEVEALENWIVVFSPDDPTTVQALDGAKAEVVDASGENVMSINSGPTGAPIQFDVGQGVLEQIAGKRAVFDIVALTGDGPETQMSVACDFGSLGDCGRNRYLVGPQRSEFLFEVEVPAGTPSGAGSITIVSDVENGGKALSIAQIRVSVTGQ